MESQGSSVKSESERQSEFLLRSESSKQYPLSSPSSSRSGSDIKKLLIWLNEDRREYNKQFLRKQPPFVVEISSINNDKSSFASNQSFHSLKGALPDSSSTIHFHRLEESVESIQGYVLQTKGQIADLEAENVRLLKEIQQLDPSYSESTLDASVREESSVGKKLMKIKKSYEEEKRELQRSQQEYRRIQKLI